MMRGKSMCTMGDGFFWLVAGVNACAFGFWVWSIRRTLRLAKRYAHLTEDLTTRLRDDLGVVWDSEEP
jgi:Na+/proline symporter